MMYQRVGIPNDTPYSQFLFKRPGQPGEASAPDDAVLALTDQTGQAEVLEGGNALNAGLVQAYEDQQRQDLATDTVTDVPFNEPVAAAAKTA